MRSPAPYIDIKYAATVRQRFDFSCGGATVATMLSKYWGRPTGEAEVVALLRSRYPQEKWADLQANGFSLEDLIWAAHQFGFEAQAAAIAANDLASVSGPVIVHLDNGVFKHFSVMRMRKFGRTYVSDPIEGATSYANDAFDRLYTGSALAIWAKGQPLPVKALLDRPLPAPDPSLSVSGAAETRPLHFAPLL